MNASNSPKLARPKPAAVTKVRQRVRAVSAKLRKEAAVLAKVRAVCVARDVYCRCGPSFWVEWGRCEGESQLAHVLGKKRSQTRGMAPEARHSPAWCLLLCAKHHEREERGVMQVVALTPDGANGPVVFPRKPPKGLARAREAS